MIFGSVPKSHHDYPKTDTNPKANFHRFRTQKGCDMPLRGCVGENDFWRRLNELPGTGTHETYETHVTHGTGTWDWDWDYGTLAMGFVWLEVLGLELTPSFPVSEWAGNRALGVVQKLRQQFWNCFELFFLRPERSVCAYATDRTEERRPKETGSVNLIFERLLRTGSIFRGRYRWFLQGYPVLRAGRCMCSACGSFLRREWRSWSRFYRSLYLVD